MKPAEVRKAELAERLQQAARENSAQALAGAIIDAIDASLPDRNRPGKRDRDAEGAGSYRPGR